MYWRPIKSTIFLHFVLCFALFLALINAKSLQFEHETVSESREGALTSSSLVDDTPADYSLIEEMKAMRRQLRHCFKVERSIWECLKSKSVEVFERVMNADVIPLYEGVRLVRQPSSTVGKTEGRSFSTDDLMKNERRDLKYLSWFDKLALSLEKALNTHNLQINLAQATSAYMRATDGQDNADVSRQDDIGSARVRRHRYNMIITMMFGVTALGALVVPIGFQLLSIVSGKALLLAKMALLLASINGLKRVANSGLHYGLYHVPGEHYGGYYDRGDLNHPRNVPIPVATISQPLDMGLK